MHPNHIIAQPAGRGLLTAVIFSFALATGCSDSGGGGGTDPVPDTTPDAFSFTDQNAVAPDTLIESAAITVSGIDEPVAISISGGEYAVDGGSFTDAAGTVDDGQAVVVRVQSATTPGAVSEATLTIGGVSDTFSVTTQNDPTGYYTGSAAVKEEDNTTDLALNDVHGLLTDERFLIFSIYNPTAGTRRSLTYEATSIEITGTDYTADLTIYDNGEVLSELTTTGTVTEGSGLTMTMGGEGAGNGIIELTYAGSNSEAAALERLENVSPDTEWLGRVNESGVSFAFQFDGSGNLSHVQDVSTSIFWLCEINGTASVIDTTALYRADITLTSCGEEDVVVDGDYTGLMTVLPVGGDDTLVLIFSDGTLAGAGVYD